MGIYELYSKRKAKREKKSADVYRYDEIPRQLRVQVVQITQEHLKLPNSEYNRYHDLCLDVYKNIVTKLRREIGEYQLPGSDVRFSGYDMDWPQELFNYLNTCKTDAFLDALELICRALFLLDESYQSSGVGTAIKDFKIGLEEINYRLKEAGLGYYFSDGEVIRVESDLIHSEAVVPALAALRLPGYAGAQAEFLKAHEHYRHGRNAEALNECYKAFESLMKAICDRHGWKYDDKWAAAKLVDFCMGKGLIPAYYHSHMIGLKSILESAIPTPRNKAGAHGAGTTPVVVPAELASYVIHMTASTLLYLTTVEKKIK